MDIFKSYIQGQFNNQPKFSVGDLIVVKHLGTRPSVEWIKRTRGFGIVVDVTKVGEGNVNSIFEYRVYFQESMIYDSFLEGQIEHAEKTSKT